MRSKIALLAILMIFISACAPTFAVPVLIQFDSSCEWEDLVPGEINLQIESDSIVIVASEMELDNIEELKEDECVQKIGRKGDLPDFLAEVEGELEISRNEKIKELQLKRNLLNEGVIEEEELDDYIENENPEETWPGGIISPYQLYVTPDASEVQALASSLEGIEEIYAVSLDWVWIADNVLHGETEHWLYPEDFLADTASYSTNPTGEIASDCEEQANTLVSTLIADGYNPENIRVVLGLVDFDGTTGGHAWVQVYEDGRWFDVEATAGSYYDESAGFVEVTTKVPYDYFKYHEYPSVEHWFYYNNDYFQHVKSGQGNAPDHWDESGGSWLAEDLEKFSGNTVRRAPRNS